MVQVGGFEPPTLRVSDENSKPAELHLHIYILALLSLYELVNLPQI